MGTEFLVRTFVSVCLDIAKLDTIPADLATEGSFSKQETELSRTAVDL